MKEYTYKVAGYEVGQDPNEEDYSPVHRESFDSEPAAVRNLLNQYNFSNDLVWYIHVYEKSGRHVGFLNHNLNVESEGMPWRIDSKLEYQLYSFLGEE